MNSPGETTEHIRGRATLEPPLPVDDLDTPALLVDAARLDRNLARMAALARETGVRLVPHAKSHKCTALAARQLAGGAAGLCTAKVSEAAVFAGAGVKDLLVAYPVVDRKAGDLAALAARHPEARFAATADSPEGVLALGEGASGSGVRLGVWLEVDVGLHRCGLPPEDPGLEDLARLVLEQPALELIGLLTHAGHVYRAKPDEVAAIGRAEGEDLVRARDRLGRAGFEGLRVSLGSTPTIPHAARVDGVDEIHPGVYVFGDRQQVSLGAMRPDDAALTVLATVVSRPAPGRWVLDAGSKTLSSDRGAHGTESIRGYGAVRRVDEHRVAGDWDPGTSPVLSRLSEEHGVLEDDRDLAWAPGDRVEIVPNHACAAVNLAETLYLMEGEGRARRATAAWPIEARARVR